MELYQTDSYLDGQTHNVAPIAARVSKSTIDYAISAKSLIRGTSLETSSAADARCGLEKVAFSIGIAASSATHSVYRDVARDINRDIKPPTWNLPLSFSLSLSHTHRNFTSIRSCLLVDIWIDRRRLRVSVITVDTLVISASIHLFFLPGYREQSRLSASTSGVYSHINLRNESVYFQRASRDKTLRAPLRKQ